jgi:hypothetical protein
VPLQRAAPRTANPAFDLAADEGDRLQGYGVVHNAARDEAVSAARCGARACAAGKPCGIGSRALLLWRLCQTLDLAPTLPPSHPEPSHPPPLQASVPSFKSLSRDIVADVNTHSSHVVALVSAQQAAAAAAGPSTSAAGGSSGGGGGRGAGAPSVPQAVAEPSEAELAALREGEPTRGAAASARASPAWLEVDTDRPWCGHS